MQALVVGAAVIDVALVVDVQSSQQEWHLANGGLLNVALPQLFADFQQLHGGDILAHQEASQMIAQAADKVLWLKAFADDVVEQEQNVGRVALQHVLDDFEIIVVIQHVEVLDDILVGNVFARETDHLVENGECVAQGAIGFLGDDVERFGFGGDAFARGNESEMFRNILNGDALEVENLATGKNGRNDFVFFGRGQNEFGIRWRLFQSLQEGVESCRRKHVNLIDYIDLILTDLRGDAHLLDKASDVFHRVV